MKSRKFLAGQRRSSACGTRTGAPNGRSAWCCRGTPDRKHMATASAGPHTHHSARHAAAQIHLRGTASRLVVRGCFEVSVVINKYRNLGIRESRLFRIPEQDFALCQRIARKIGWRGAIHLGNERWLMHTEKCFDLWQRRHKMLRKLGIRRLADHDEQSNAMLHDRLALIDFVADALVVGDRDAAFGAAIFQPLLIGTIRWKQIVMPLYL